VPYVEQQRCVEKFVAPEVKNDNEEVPEMLGAFIRQADWIYPSSIISIILKVRLSFQLGVFPQLFSAIADLWGL
jgi:hypothetical protein